MDYILNQLDGQKGCHGEISYVNQHYWGCKMTIKEIIQNAIPNANEELCEYIVWSRTPYPCGALGARELYQAARRLKRATDNGHRLCDLCDRIAILNKSVCKKCDDALRL